MAPYAIYNQPSAVGKLQIEDWGLFSGLSDLGFYRLMYGSVL
ncbi:hypothetical protein KsCSTR_11540 [Candidatus Kuenenia stuttgartiensis]|uniref:Uncharacterized protein n=1 Tax=Kuenenia stuttgartiensis TaxID=174633 RepID=A0A6G7GMI8_KUEST|nr:hypothetical protein KsCSTR_11540 [Candidatus Kuenenia stuttgartiensis]